MNSNIKNWVFSILCSLMLYYVIVGTSSNVVNIREQAPTAFAEKNWEILRYEGYTHGRFNKHGGSAWYHVQDIDTPSIQYRVGVTMWNDELQFYYGEPESITRFNVNIDP